MHHCWWRLLIKPCTFPDRVGGQAMRDCVGPLGIRENLRCRLGMEDYYRFIYLESGFKA
jgi:hypothetical protein